MSNYSDHNFAIPLKCIPYFLEMDLVEFIDLIDPLKGHGAPFQIYKLIANRAKSVTEPDLVTICETIDATSSEKDILEQIDNNLFAWEDDIKNYLYSVTDWDIISDDEGNFINQGIIFTINKDLFPYQELLPECNHIFLLNKDDTQSGYEARHIETEKRNEKIREYAESIKREYSQFASKKSEIIKQMKRGSKPASMDQELYRTIKELSQRTLRDILK